MSESMVRLRIAGIYYERSFHFKDLETRAGTVNKVTIEHLLQEASDTAEGNYSKLLCIFKSQPASSHTGLINSLVSFGVELLADLPVSLSTKPGGRPSGFYQLTEFEFPNGVVAWQYYVFGKDGVSKSQRKPITPGSAFSPVEGNVNDPFTPFDGKVLEAGDQVIWRQVAILREPSGKVLS